VNRMSLALFVAGFGSALVLLPGFGVSKSAKPRTEAQGDPSQKLRDFLEADWKHWMEEYPDVATRVGYPGQNDRWTDDSPAGIERRKKHLADSLATLKAMSRNALPASEQLNLDLYLAASQPRDWRGLRAAYNGCSSGHTFS
jgi:uncharacterized protein (DUF885 family)